MNKPTLIQGDNFRDNRGQISFVNDFDLTPVKRFYAIKHPDKSVVRAWQGHRQESKWFKCISGSFVVAWKKIDDFENPIDGNIPDYVILKEDINSVLFIPPGYANGLKALEENSEIFVFSDHKLDESLDDKIRFDKDLWLNWEQF